MDPAAYGAMYELEERHWWFRGRRAVVRAILDRVRVPAGPRVLDAGCGTGRNLQEYARLGAVQGVDPSPRAIELCRRRGITDVAVAGLEDLPFDSDSFELVCTTDVLEHVEDDRAALLELRRVTAPGGILLATVPAHRWLWSDADVALGHYRRYTRPELAERVREAGWHPELLTHFNTLLLPPIALARRLRRRPGKGDDELRATPRRLDLPLSLPMRGEAALIRRGLRLPAGSSIGIVARRA